MAKYFKDSEFKACTPSCSIEQMDKAFLSLLDDIREYAGIPIVLNSAYRSPAYEKKHGRTGTSASTDPEPGRHPDRNRIRAAPPGRPPTGPETAPAP